MKRIIKPFYVINWDFNRDEIEYYDIMPYLVRQYKEIKSKNRPKSLDEIKEFINNESKHQFWSRCEYEVIVTGWPQQKNKIKIDVYDQIKNNLDVITKHFIDSVL